MKIIRNERLEPAYNLALEEYVHTELVGDFIILWRNKESVIIGKNQNSLSELDMDFVQLNKIEVVRRNSGGGAVFHDVGNINFTFIEDYTTESFNNYSKFTAPIVEYLKTFGISSELSGRNDLQINGVKISGNAQAVRGGRLMHHGTLLYSANLSKLVGALRPKPIKHIGREVKSVSARVANITSLHDNMPKVEEFLNGLFKFFSNRENVEIFELEKGDYKKIEEIAERKYRSWDWNFGKAPKFSVEKSQKYPFGVVEIFFDVSEGRFKNLQIFGDFFGIDDCRKLCEKIEGTRYDKSELSELLSDMKVSEFISGMKTCDLVDLIFD